MALLTLLAHPRVAILQGFEVCPHAEGESWANSRTDASDSALRSGALPNSGIILHFASGNNTNCAVKVRECAGLESPLTPTLSLLDKGGEGREWGDSARAGICELWLGDW